MTVTVFRLKVEQPQEVVTGNPTVFKMLVSFYRHARGHNALRQILGSAVKDVLSDGALSIRTDPLEIYKTWINQTETRTGTKRLRPLGPDRTTRTRPATRDQTGPQGTRPDQRN